MGQAETQKERDGGQGQAMGREFVRQGKDRGRWAWDRDGQGPWEERVWTEEWKRVGPCPRKAMKTHLTSSNLHQREALPFCPHQDLEALFILKGRQRGRRWEGR